LADSGGYEVHAPPNAPPGTKKEATRTMQLIRKIWYDKPVEPGEHHVVAPIISGIRKFPKAAISTGIATQKIMTEPWFVTSALYSVGDTMPKPGHVIRTPGNASCMRKT
jgi:hypothetical protein